MSWMQWRLDDLCRIFTKRLTASCFLGALRPVDLLALCIVRAIVVRERASARHTCALRR